MKPLPEENQNPLVEIKDTNDGQSPSKKIKNEVFSVINHDQMSEAITIMKNRLPRSAHVYNMAKMACKFPSIKTYTLNDDLTEKAIFVITDFRQDFHQDINISVPWDFKVTESVKQAFIHTSIIDWDDVYMFTAVDRLISPMILEISTIHKRNSTLNNANYYYYMAQEDAANLDIKLPSTVEVKPLNTDANGGLDLLVNGWKYARPGTSEFLQDVIDKGWTSGVFVDGVSVCGIIQNRHGLIGMLFTAKDHRNKGYAQICTKYLMKQLGMNGFVVASGVECRNTASREFHKKIGLAEVYECDDIIFENHGFEAK